MRGGRRVCGVLVVLVAVLAWSLSGAARPALAVAQAGPPTQKVIVIFKNQESGLPATPTLVEPRRHAIQAVQQPVTSQLSASGARNVHSYTVLNAVSATVSTSEETQLKSDPTVSAVIPDQIIKLAPEQATAVPSSAGGTATSDANVCTSSTPGQLNPQALETIGADSDQPGAPTARSLGFTGAGVTVAFIADGLDIDNQDFIRANGQHVFTDYKDFSGEGTKVPTGGEEAFGDASSIAAQGLHTYNVAGYGPDGVSGTCNIRVEGVAPGANLVGLDIFGAEDAGYNSSFLQAIDYAVTTDHVNVLNESLGNNYYPDDQASLDAIKQANDNAVAAGTTVTVSSGDAGVTNTIGTPSTDPDVISVGASTTYRIDLQDGYGGAQFPGVTGYLNNDISSFSSGGFEQDGRTVDVVAPGELNWALCSTDTKMYADCLSLAGNPSPVIAFGGTSESAPLTAGLAALVIQAYRKGHGGANPTPAVVKQIIISTADDIGSPADQQGAGLIDAYQAVLAAESYATPTTTSTPVGETVLQSAGQLNAVGQPGAAQSLSDTITNNGTDTQTVSLSTRKLGRYTTVKTAGVTLSDADSPKTTDYQGLPANYETVTFNVPGGAQSPNRLSVSLAVQEALDNGLPARVRLTLIDPNGNLAAYSVPQGDGNYGNAQVTNPAPGTWTAYVWSRTSANGGTQGPVLLEAQVASYATFGNVFPSKVTLAPGASATVRLSVNTPSTPGDSAGAIVVSSMAKTPAPTPTSSAAATPTPTPSPSPSTSPTASPSPAASPSASTSPSPTPTPSAAPTPSQSPVPSTNTTPAPAAAPNVTTIPVTLRSKIPSGTQSFTQTLTGGNGRAPNTGETFYYQVDVPAGTPELNASVALADNPNNPFTEWLVSPSGEALAQSANELASSTAPGYTNLLGAQAHVLAPAAGTWTLIIGFIPQVSGTALAEPFTVDTSDLPVPASSGKLPDSSHTKLHAGHAYTYDVHVTNTGPEPEAYFVDARLPGSTTMSLTALTNPDTTVPLTIDSSIPVYELPTHTTGLTAVATTTGTTPIQFDTGAPTGDPDVISTVGTDVSASFEADSITQGEWNISPTVVGPFGAKAAPSEAVSTTMTIAAEPFDPSVTSPTSDLWQLSVNPAESGSFAPVIVGPGQTATIPVTITPTGKAGTRVSGTLYIDDTDLFDFQGFTDLSGGEVAALPYSYTVGKAKP